jgi:toxin ParE1/3/4
VTRPLIVQQEAEADIAEAYRWYEMQRFGLGQEFLESVDRAFERLAENPLRHAPVHRDTRRTFLRRFPYVVFHVLRNEHVHVLAVLHQRRNPRIARNRTSRFESK